MNSVVKYFIEFKKINAENILLFFLYAWIFFCDSLKIYAKFIPLNHFQAKCEGVRWSGRNFRALIIKKTPTVCLVKVNSSFIFQCFNRKHRKTVIYCICLIISSNYNVNDSNVYLRQMIPRWNFCDPINQDSLIILEN